MCTHRDTCVCIVAHSCHATFDELLCSVAGGLLAQRTADIAGKQFVLSAATAELQADQDARWQLRTVLVKNVPQDMEETLLMYLENKRKGGGAIESTQTDEYYRTVMVTFCDENGMSFEYDTVL